VAWPVPLAGSHSLGQGRHRDRRSSRPPARRPAAPGARRPGEGRGRPE